MSTPILAAAGVLALTFTLWWHYSSPLAKIPGPFLWSWSSIPYVYHLARGSASQRILELHDQYGPVVRLSPRQVSFASTQAYKDIYTRKPNGDLFVRDQFWLTTAPGRVNSIVTVPLEQHASMRKVMLPSFDYTALPDQEPVIQKHARRFVDKLKLLAASSETCVVDFTEWSMFEAYDCIGELTFGDEIFDNIATGRLHPALVSFAALAKNQAYNVCAKHLFHPFTDALAAIIQPLAAFGERKEEALVEHLMKVIGARMTKPPDLKHKYKDLFASLMAGVERGEVTPEEVGANGGILLAGGGETVGDTLSAAVNYLVRNPPQLERATREVRQTFKDASEVTGAAVANLEYLNAVLKEAMRLGSPVPTAVPRVVESQSGLPGALVGGYWIPNGTHVGVHNWALVRSQSHWHKADAFLPERWLPSSRTSASPFAHDDHAASQPFSHGVMRCMGQYIAWLELRVVLALLILTLDLSVPAPFRQRPDSFPKWECQLVRPMWEKQPAPVQLALAACE